MDKLIGIIGAGVMGQGVAFQLAKFDYDVILVDLTDEVLQKARQGIINISRLDIMMIGQKKSPAAVQKDPLSKIKFTTDMQQVAGCFMVIENVPEKQAAKLQVYEQLSNIVSDTALIAVNTSATPITRLSTKMKVPGNVMGIHFVNPVHMMPTVEMVKGLFTTEDTINRANLFLASLGMKGVLVNDSPGFVSNRVMLMYLNEAIFCVQENVGTAADVDEIFRECLSHKMGPLETTDLIGLDTILYSLEVLYDEFKDDKYRPAFLLRQMVDAGLLGRKSGRGFYEYR
jgi:3-hydroxybutyryl-CoA dehydrogenase